MSIQLFHQGKTVDRHPAMFVGFSGADQRRANVRFQHRHGQMTSIPTTRTGAEHSGQQPQLRRHRSTRRAAKPQALRTALKTSRPAQRPGRNSPAHGRRDAAADSPATGKAGFRAVLTPCARSPASITHQLLRDLGNPDDGIDARSCPSDAEDDGCPGRCGAAVTWPAPASATNGGMLVAYLRIGRSDGAYTICGSSTFSPKRSEKSRCSD